LGKWIKETGAVSGEKHPQYGVHRSEETIRKLRVFEELHDKDWLYKKHVEEKLTCPEIATILGCSDAAVYKARKQFGIPKQKRHHSEEAKQKMREARKDVRFPTHHTKPEIIFEQFCEQDTLPFKHTGDGLFWIEGKPAINPDFIHLTKKIVVEIFSYWHDPLRRHCKVRYSATYEGRKKILKKRGWKLIVFWQEDLEREDAEAFVLATLKREGVI
jgi:G:T-mismatch repair DNA endonuclease (very short patch repair protein)